MQHTHEANAIFWRPLQHSCHRADYAICVRNLSLTQLPRSKEGIRKRALQRPCRRSTNDRSVSRFRGCPLISGACLTVFWCIWFRCHSLVYVRVAWARFAVRKPDKTRVLRSANSNVLHTGRMHAFANLSHYRIRAQVPRGLTKRLCRQSSGYTISKLCRSPVCSTLKRRASLQSRY